MGNHVDTFGPIMVYLAIQWVGDLGLTPTRSHNGGNLLHRGDKVHNLQLNLEFPKPVQETTCWDFETKIFTLSPRWNVTPLCGLVG